MPPPVGIACSRNDYWKARRDITSLVCGVFMFCTYLIVPTGPFSVFVLPVFGIIRS